GVRLWGTHVGGGWDDVAYGIEVDPSNNVLLTGQTSSSNFPVMSAGVAFYQAALSGSSDLFVMRFDAAGAQTWGTFAGSSQSELGNFIICDNAGKIYVTGSSTGSGFPTVDPGGGAYYEATYQGTGPGALPYRGDLGDAVIMRFANTGALEWSTYYGGPDSDAGRSIAVNNNGDIYVTGDTRSGASFPVQNGGGSSYNQAPGGSDDAFYLRFNAQCQRNWGTLFGGSGDEYSGAITVDNCGNVYGTGHSYSTNMPTVNPGNSAFFVPNNLSTDDVYFVQFDLQNALTWSTYNGTTGFDEKGTSIEIAPNGDIYAVGWWCFYSTSNGVMNPGSGAYY
ncbi:MAG: SBBP repeat-containing protein, partial [Bacteroidia bacterium]